VKYEDMVDGLRAYVVNSDNEEILVVVANCSNQEVAEVTAERVNELFALIAEGVLDE
jgi:hypothetical protein